MEPMDGSSKESSEELYVGNAVPRILRFAWTVFILFGIVYMIRYAYPDLKEWIAKFNAG